MRAFSELAKELHLEFPMRQELWTFYHLEKHHYPKDPSDWGMSLVYHFDRGISITHWLQLYEAVRIWVQSRPTLNEIIHFVPFYEIGSDFFVQRKPRYDGEYSTAMYGEFLEDGSCEPAPWFFDQIANLHRRITEERNLLRTGRRNRFLRHVIDATFITPHGELFWWDDEGWGLYWPNISAKDVEDWVELTAH
ncbi:hypothetical protein AYO44_15185 [Planctomycetaceae bacterium SCGC AG-212-F19]|nr:hypothetical protein AYO44_15185 [Planctomycetaceae bacterium SCGC AG-212-F19]